MTPSCTVVLVVFREVNTENSTGDITAVTGNLLNVCFKYILYKTCHSGTHFSDSVTSPKVCVHATRKKWKNWNCSPPMKRMQQF